jgi:hypothetical protein
MSTIRATNSVSDYIEIQTPLKGYYGLVRRGSRTFMSGSPLKHYERRHKVILICCRHICKYGKMVDISVLPQGLGQVRQRNSQQSQCKKQIGCGHKILFEIQGSGGPCTALGPVQVFYQNPPLHGSQCRARNEGLHHSQCRARVRACTAPSTVQG